MSLTFTTIKRFKPENGVRRGLVDITFDASGPTWAITNANFKLNGLWNLIMPAHKDGFVLAYVPSTILAGTIDARQEADSGSALKAIDPSDINTKVVRVEYVGF